MSELTDKVLREFKDSNEKQKDRAKKFRKECRKHMETIEMYKKDRDSLRLIVKEQKETIHLLEKRLRKATMALDEHGLSHAPITDEITN